MSTHSPDAAGTTTAQSTDEEHYEFDLDYQVLAHATDLDSWAYLKAHGITAKHLMDEDVLAVSEWVDSYILDFQEAPSGVALRERAGSRLIQPVVSGPGYLVARLRERAVRNTARRRVQDLLHAVVDPEIGKQPDRLLALLAATQTDLEAHLPSSSVIYSDADVHAVDWLWDTFIPIGVVTLLAGKGGGGKTTLAVDIIAHLTRGTLPGVLDGTPTDVLVVADEDDARQVWNPRMLAAGADFGRVHHWRGAFEFGQHGEALRREVRRTGAKFVFFDQITDAMGKIDDWRAKDTRMAFKPFGELARSENIAIMGVTHLIKGVNPQDPGSAVSGSHAYRDVCRSLLMLDRLPEDAHLGIDARRCLWVEKSNYGSAAKMLIFDIEYVPQLVHSVTRGQQVHGTYGRIVNAEIVDADRRQSTKTPKLDECRQWLTDYLTSEGPTSSKEAKKIARERGYSDALVATARQAEDIYVTNEGRTTIWSLNDNQDSNDDTQA